jgi:hypothetical protein
MEVIRGRERDCRQEIRGQARPGGMRSTQRVDSQRQASLAVHCGNSFQPSVKVPVLADTMLP